MIFVQANENRLRRGIRNYIPLALLVLLCPFGSHGALPKRLILCLDGVSYRDVKTLQDGITATNDGRVVFRQAFRDGYFPVSRNISTFPSTSDVAWTDMFGDRPVPGYQRTYFSGAADAQIFQNGVSTTMEFEKQMHWQVESGFRRAMGYIHVQRSFQDEMVEMVDHFLAATNAGGNYYAMMRSTDDGQHMSGDIFEMLCALDGQLRELGARYKTLTGRDLEILILSDHGNNHAGSGKRVEVATFLEHNGYHVTESIRKTKEIVVPTVGIESWVEIHNAPAETQRLVPLLCELEGVDIVTARVPGEENKFIVMNAAGERALIDWDPSADSYRYTREQGDPLGYRLVVEELATKNKLRPDGFAAADDWMAETLNHRYPLALERIARAHTRITLNPATVLVSLKNGYVHAGWAVKAASRLVTTGGTHGALDDVNSVGIVLSNFRLTRDTSTSRVAAQFDGFNGLRNYRREENGAEWFSRKAQAMTAIKRTALDDPAGCRLPDDGLFLRVWTPDFVRGITEPMQIVIEKDPRYPSEPSRTGSVKAPDVRHLTLSAPLAFDSRYERVYQVPDLALAPQDNYRISGSIGDDERLFTFNFRTDTDGKPVAY